MCIRTKICHQGLIAIRPIELLFMCSLNHLVNLRIVFYLSSTYAYFVYSTINYKIISSFLLVFYNTNKINRVIDELLTLNLPESTKLFFIYILIDHIFLIRLDIFHYLITSIFYHTKYKTMVLIFIIYISLMTSPRP